MSPFSSDVVMRELVIWQLVVRELVIWQLVMRELVPEPVSPGEESLGG